jgi:hypothetical protein
VDLHLLERLLVFHFRLQVNIGRFINQYFLFRIDIMSNELVEKSEKQRVAFFLPIMLVDDDDDLFLRKND